MSEGNDTRWRAGNRLRQQHPPSRGSRGGNGGAPAPAAAWESEEEAANREDESGAAGPSGERCSASDADETARRLLRQQYRELMCTVQQNREMMLSAKNDKLTEALEDANKLFTGVSRPREAALDSQFLVMASDLGKEKASQLHSDMAAFDPSAFAEDLLAFMGFNCLENEGSDNEEEQLADGYLPGNAWLKLGYEAKKYFRRAPVFHFMLGSFNADPPVVRPRIERQRKRAGLQEGRAMPAQLKKMDESHQEATEKEVERILGLLQAYYNQDPNTPISFLEFVTDPNSFARTVENMFHVSFLIRDGLAEIRLDQDKLPVIEPLHSEGGEKDQDAQARKQAVISMSFQEWQNIVQTFEISQAMIPHDSRTQT